MTAPEASPEAPAITLDRAPDRSALLAEVMEGLAARPRCLPSKLLYDDRGSELFDRICELDAYYPTRTELSILERFAPEMASFAGADCLLVEYGSGSSLKTRRLLDALESPAAYIPVDISRDHLANSAAALARDYPGLEVLPVCADFEAQLTLPRPRRAPARRVAFFPGSTIGNFSPEAAGAFLRRVRELVGPQGGLLLGVDLLKDRCVLERAYDDPEGVTAEFNRNLLRHVNRVLGADFEPERFRHEARFREAPPRIEMHLVSERAQRVRVGGHTVDLAAGESLCTEYCHKYRLEDVAELAGSAGFRTERVFTDPKRWFSVHALSAA